MNKRLFPLSFALAFVAACAASPEPTVSEDTGDAGEDALSQDGQAHFIVTRRDLRKCAWPMCGGVYVKRVNSAQTRCADGTRAKECYVASVDYEGAGLSQDEGATFDNSFSAGQGIVHGALVTADNGYVTYASLNASEAFVARAGATPSGVFYAVTGTGIQCITYPCPTATSVKLNGSKTTTLAGVDLDASGAPAEALAEGYDAIFAQKGALVAGFNETVTGPAGKMPELVATEFYTRVVHTACEPDAAAAAFWGANVGEGAVLVQVKTEAEGMSYVDPEGRSVYWYAAEAPSETAARYVAGINDLWAVRFEVDLAGCAVTITAEH
jgi:hypothetical protein